MRVKDSNKRSEVSHRAHCPKDPHTMRSLMVVDGATSEKSRNDISEIVGS